MKNSQSVQDLVNVEKGTQKYLLKTNAKSAKGTVLTVHSVTHSFVLNVNKKEIWILSYGKIFANTAMWIVYLELKETVPVRTHNTFSILMAQLVARHADIKINTASSAKTRRNA